MSLSTHVLDTSKGKPAAGVPILVEKKIENEFARIGGGVSDADGRVKDLVAGGALMEGTYRITFDTGAYFAQLGVEGFYPEAQVQFIVRDASAHYHVPLLLSPFGYSTYRGS